MENRDGIGYRFIDFIVHTNIFIALCAASLTAWTELLFLHSMPLPSISVTFCATFLLYNVQRLYLSYFNRRKYSFKDWYYKNKTAIFILMALSLAGLYPVVLITWKNVLVYSASFLLGVFYFLPFSNLRAIPVVKSTMVGLVWVLVCVIAPMEKISLSEELLMFAFMQLIFVSALCVLFNIRDVEEDRASGTHSIPVLFGIQPSRNFVYGAMLLYLACMFFVSPSLSFGFTCTFIFFLTLLFTAYAHPSRHSFYFGLGVDGLILVQCACGILLSEFIP